MRWPWSRRARTDEAPWTWPTSDVQAANLQSGGSNSFPGLGYYDGSNFLEGVGGKIDEISNLDYWKLRQRSAALFYGNLYARGIIRRMVTDIINTGLEPESTPEEQILGLPEDALADWSETVETIWRLYGESKEIVDYKGNREEGELQAQIYTEALVCGDCLVVNRINPDTDLPQIQIVNGDRVRTPMEYSTDLDVIDGVRVDRSSGRHIGYYVYNGTVDIYNDTYQYIPAIGAASGRKTAWLVYGPDKREDGIRGEPLLGIAIQPLKEIHDYRGNTQLKLKLNSMIAMFIKRAENRPKTTPIRDAAVRRDAIVDNTGSTSNVQFAQISPGIVLEKLEPGEEPVPFSTHGTDSSFGDFEASIMVGVAWGLQIPPEILLMSFNKAYAASQAANNKWKTLIRKERVRFSSGHCKSHYEEWFISSVLSGKIQAIGFLDSLIDMRLYDIRRAWLKTEWFGQIEPTVDPVKHVTAAKMAIAEGFSTRTREARQYNGSKFTHNARRNAKEAALLAASLRPLLELQNEFGQGALGALLNNHPEMLAAGLLAAAQEEAES